MKGAQCDLDLVFGRLASGHPLEPKAGLDEILNPPAPPFLIGEPDDLISEPGDEWDEDHSRGHFIPKPKMMRDEGKDQDAHHHDDEKEARSTSRMKVTKAFYPIGRQHLAGLEGKDRLVLRPMIFKDSSDLFGKGDRPQISQKDD
jgi:hypothetical protein